MGTSKLVRNSSNSLTRATTSTFQSPFTPNAALVTT